ncbi:hypothetical protein KIPB_002797, partial [Kipferlia bialata]
KSSALRVLCGLWDHERGTIERPHAIGNKGIFFVPQSTYIVHNGSLRAQICYPIPEGTVCNTPDYVFESAMGLCNLDYLLGRFTLDSKEPWAEILSGGERQRLGLARLLFHSPAFAVMDESTAALPIDIEASILSECVSRGITLLSVAHRQTVYRHHRYNLHVTKEGWELREFVNQD